MFIIHVSTALTDLVTGFFIPVIVGLITKSSATPFQKRLTLAVLSAITAVVSTLVTTANAVVGWGSVLNLFLAGAMAFAAYMGWWKGATTFEALKAATATFGIGSSPDKSSLRRNDEGDALLGPVVLSAAVAVLTALAMAWLLLPYVYRR